MKKSIIILLVIISIFVASCSPQVTFTSEVTVTLPTPTQTPEPSATPTAAYTPTPIQEVVSIGGNLSVVLGEKVDGGTVIDKFVLDPSLTTEQQDFLYEQLNGNAEKLGLDGTWIQTDDNRTLFVESADHTNILAERKMVELLGMNEVVWDWQDVEPMLLEKGRQWKMNGKVPDDIQGILAYQSSLRSRLTDPLYQQIKTSYPQGTDAFVAQVDNGTLSGALFSSSGESMMTYVNLTLVNEGVGTSDISEVQSGYVATAIKTDETSDEYEDLLLYTDNLVMEYLQ